MKTQEDLLIVACSERKRERNGLTPAIELYDGPAYRVIRKHLSGTGLSPTIWILSAKHGLLWADSYIFPYDERMDKEKIEVLRSKVESFINHFAPSSGFARIFVWASKPYLKILPPSLLTRSQVYLAEGPIGNKLHTLKNWCIAWQEATPVDSGLLSTQKRIPSRMKRMDMVPLNYFVPDWDDYLDAGYDFLEDRFSWLDGERVRSYAHELFRGRPLYDGLLVSLGHIFMGKGFARNGLKSGNRITSARKHLHLGNNLMLMGDCGAFSYRRMMKPPFSTEQVVRLYRALRVDIGASIDHIPFGEVDESGDVRQLSDAEANSRIEMTARLGREFLEITHRTNAGFIPMGVIQGTCKEEYADIAREYVGAGYRYIALGGLVRKKDDDILQIVDAITSAINQSVPVSSTKVRVHLFGVLRKELLPRLKDLGVASFDSGSYLRKAWLRSDKNYLSSSNKWYSAVRVPYSSDTRFQKNATEKGIAVSKLQSLETECLRLLKDYEKRREGLSNILDKIMEYDSLLLRTSDTNDLREKYETTLKDAPWEQCDCPVCKALGIDVVIFRGFNRNKRRGFHNTGIFYKQLMELRKRT